MTAELLRWLAARSTPEPVRMKARLLVLDTLGCIVAGASAEPVRELARSLGALECGAVRLPGFKSGLAPLSAASCAAIAACWDEACEGHARAHGRPGVPVIAAALAIGCARDARLGEVMEAIVTGYETGARMGEALRIGPGMHVDPGWPALGVAAGVARLVGADAAAAVEIAASQMPFGLYLPIAQGADARNTYLGHAAWLGTHAALATSAGMTAPRGAVEQYAALALAREIEREPLGIAPPGEDWILDAYLKPFAAVRHVHYGAQAALEMRREIGETVEIGKIVLSVYDEAIVYCGNRDPRTPIQAQFSLSFGLAAALRFGALEPETYRAPRFDDPELRRLEHLVAIQRDTARGAAGARGATVVVEARGRRFERSVEAVKGDPAAPMSAGEVRDKFLRYAAALGAARARALADQVLEAPPDTPLKELVS
jgi:2-methylcitrate dehydratase PrpD